MTQFAANVQKGFDTVLAGNWEMIDVANGFRSGFGNANTYYNLSESTCRLKSWMFSDRTFMSFLGTWVQSSWKIGKTALKAYRVSPLATHPTALKCAAAGWIGMNALALIQHAVGGYNSAIVETCFGTVWELTPNTLLITNIVLTTLELQVNFTKALVSFISMGISYVDFKDKLPKNRNVIWNWVLPISMRAVVLYYGNNWQRTMIAVDAVTSTARFVIQSRSV
jgi:hypothetical protein